MLTWYRTTYIEIYTYFLHKRRGIMGVVGWGIIVICILFAAWAVGKKSK